MLPSKNYSEGKMVTAFSVTKLTLGLRVGFISSHLTTSGEIKLIFFWGGGDKLQRFPTGGSRLLKGSQTVSRF